MKKKNSLQTATDKKLYKKKWPEYKIILNVILSNCFKSAGINRCQTGLIDYWPKISIPNSCNIAWKEITEFYGGYVESGCCKKTTTKNIEARFPKSRKKKMTPEYKYYRKDVLIRELTFK